MRSTPSARASPSRPSRSTRVFEAARALGLPVKLHADQLSNLGGAALAAALRRLSADHSNMPTRPASRRWRRPAPSRCCCPAPSTSCARRRCRRSICLRKHGVPMAIATDCNPGTSPLTSLLLTHEHGGDLVPADRRRMPARRDPQCRARARAGSTRSARSKPASRATSRSGTSSARPSWSTASASTRCIARLEGPMTPDHARRAVARRLARDLSRRRADARSRLRAGHRALGRRGRRRSSPRASRSTASTPASESSRACASPPADLATLQRNIVLSHCRRRRRAHAGAGRAADDGAEARQPRAGRLGRAARDRAPARGDAGARA